MQNTVHMNPGRMEIRSIGVWSIIKTGFFVHLVVGFLFGILAAIILPFWLTIMAGFPMTPIPDYPMEDPSSAFGPLLVVLPFMYAFGLAFFGTLWLAVVALIYNLAAKLLGGLELHLQPVEQEYAYRPQQPPLVQPTAAPPPPPPPAAPTRPETYAPQPAKPAAPAQHKTDTDSDKDGQTP